MREPALTSSPSATQPIITHLHGGNSDFQFDGNPELFYSPDGEVNGPQWGHETLKSKE